MAENGLEHALKAIDPVARAMLDLSIRRRLPDSSIGDLAQMPPDELVRWRGEVLDQLASQIGLTGPDARDEVRTRLEAIDSSAWVVSSQAAATPAPTPSQAQKAKPRRARERPSARLLWLLALLVVVVIVVAAISLAGDDESGGSDPPPPPTSSTQTQTQTQTQSTTTEPTTTTTQPATEPTTMDPLPGMPDRGSATVSVIGSGDERSIEVRLKGMPPPGGGSGVYELWLYNTLIGAEPLGSVDRGDGTISAALPANAGDFGYLDLSRESDPDDRVHSGVSIRRAELAPLLADAPTE